jgi:hypothetical protein
MPTYTDVFGGANIYPSEITYSAAALSANIVLSWPEETSTNTNLATRSIVATSLAVIALVSAGGVAAAAWQGAVDWHLAVPFAAGAIAAMLAGRQLAARLAGKRLQQAFAAVSAAVAVLMLARSLGWIAAQA